MKTNPEDRLTNFGIGVLQIKKELKPGYESTHLYQQLFRSATAVPLNYAESKAGESIKDFVHKMTLCLKELHESHTNLRMLQQGDLLLEKINSQKLINEAFELISILTKSIKTTKERYPHLFR